MIICYVIVKTPFLMINDNIYIIYSSSFILVISVRETSWSWLVIFFFLLDFEPYSDNPESFANWACEKRSSRLFLLTSGMFSLDLSACFSALSAISYDWFSTFPMKFKIWIYRKPALELRSLERLDSARNILPKPIFWIIEAKLRLASTWFDLTKKGFWLFEKNFATHHW